MSGSAVRRLGCIMNALSALAPERATGSPLEAFPAKVPLRAMAGTMLESSDVARSLADADTQTTMMMEGESAVATAGVAGSVGGKGAPGRHREADAETALHTAKRVRTRYQGTGHWRPDVDEGGGVLLRSFAEEILGAEGAGSPQWQDLVGHGVATSEDAQPPLWAT